MGGEFEFEEGSVSRSRLDQSEMVDVDRLLTCRQSMLVLITAITSKANKKQQYQTVYMCRGKIMPPII